MGVVGCGREPTDSTAATSAPSAPEKPGTRVTVIDWRGEPVEGAQVDVNLWAAPSMSTVATGRTDASGVAVVHPLDPALRYKLHVASMADKAELVERRVEDWAPAPTTVRLERGYSIRGHLRDSEGRPVTYRAVRYRDDHGDLGGGTISGEKGEYRLVNVPYRPVIVFAPSGDGSSEEDAALATPEEPRADLVLGQRRRPSLPPDWEAALRQDPKVLVAVSFEAASLQHGFTSLLFEHACAYGPEGRRMTLCLQGATLRPAQRASVSTIEGLLSVQWKPWAGDSLLLERTDLGSKEMPGDYWVEWSAAVGLEGGPGQERLAYLWFAVVGGEPPAVYARASRLSDVKSRRTEEGLVLSAAFTAESEDGGIPGRGSVVVRVPKAE